MEDKTNDINRNNTWELTIVLPQVHKVISVKWVFKTKGNTKGEAQKQKVRLVAKGYEQQYKVDYEELFALVAQLETMRLLILLIAQKK
jgi:hypothetical protein